MRAMTLMNRSACALAVLIAAALAGCEDKRGGGVVAVPGGAATQQTTGASTGAATGGTQGGTSSAAPNVWLPQASAQTPAGTQHQAVYLAYTLTDAQSDPADVQVDYSIDQGQSYKSATAGWGGDAARGLSTSPVGVAHVYAWRAQADLAAGSQPTVILRLTPSDSAGAGAPALSGPFTVEPDPGAGRLSRGPYLQNLRASAVLVVFKTVGAQAADVEYGPTPALGLVQASTVGETHAVELAGLASGVRQFYRVRVNGQAATGVIHFRSAPATGQRAVHFTVAGDLGMGNQDQRELSDQIEKLDPDFFVMPGDIVYPLGGASDYDPHFFQPYRNLLDSVTAWPTLGNHDLIAGPYFENFYLPTNNPQNSERYYSFDYGDVHVATIDTSLGFVVPGSEQIKWLEADLAASSALWKFVHFHHAPFSSGVHGSNFAIRYVVGPIMEKYGVDICFTGHDHDYERIKPQAVALFGGHQVHYIVVGGGSGTRSIKKQNAFTAYAEARVSFAHVTIEGRKLTHQAVDQNGNVFDSLTFTK